MTAAQSIAILREEAARAGLSPAMVTTLEHIMMAESNGNPNCKAGTSSASGLFQILRAEWQDLCRRHPDLNPGGVFDARQNARAGIYMLAEKAEQLRRNIGHEPSAGELYLAHFAGLTGATRILNAAPDTPMTQLMSEQAINANDFVRNGRRQGVRYQRPDGTTVFLRDMSAAEMRAWADQKMGRASGVRVPRATGTGTSTGTGTGEEDDETHNPESPEYTPGRNTELVEALLRLFTALLASLFGDNNGQSPETAPGTPSAPDAPREPSSYIQPEIERDLVVTNNAGTPDSAATQAQMLRIFDANRDGIIAAAEILRFDLDHDGVLDLGDLPSIRQQLQAANVTLPNTASMADVLSAFSALPRPPQTTTPTPPTR